MVSLRTWVEPPRFTALPYRLRDAADGPRNLTGHAKLGLMYQPDSCVVPLETSTQCVSGVGLLPAKVPLDGANWRGTDPFAVYTWLDCGLVGVGETELKRRTLAAHRNNVETAVERVFWEGSAYNPNVQHLAEDTEIIETSGGSEVVIQTAASVVTGTYDVVEAIGILEYLGARNGYAGKLLIHMPRELVAHMAANHLLVTRGPQLETPGGSIVVGGAGYLRTGPDGTTPADGVTWIYATGSVAWWESDVMWQARDAREFLGRDINDTVLILEQWFAVGWDCAHYALQVSTGGVITGDPQSAT